MVAALGLPRRFLLILGVHITAVFGAEYLPVARGCKFLATAGADFFHHRRAAVLHDFLRLALLPVLLFPRPLSCKPFLPLLFLLRSHRHQFFLGVGKIDLPHILEINIHLLGPDVALALGFMDSNPVHQLPQHGVRDHSRILVLADHGDKSLRVRRPRLVVAHCFFDSINLILDLRLFVIVLLHKLLILALREQTGHKVFIQPPDKGAQFVIPLLQPI